MCPDIHCTYAKTIDFLMCSGMGLTKFTFLKALADFRPILKIYSPYIPDEEGTLWNFCYLCPCAIVKYISDTVLDQFHIEPEQLMHSFKANVLNGKGFGCIVYCYIYI